MRLDGSQASTKTSSASGKAILTGGGFFWIAVDDHDRVIGSIGYSRIPDTAEAFLHRLYVKPSLKRKGIGSALLKTAETAMRKAGLTVSHVHLGSPRSQWFESHSFYP